jgi:glycosyltransferase involved in cell wall biosynthesis
MARRVLYVEMAFGFGGSIVSLYQLVQGLDRTRYEPVVLFYRPNAYLPRFEALGAKVIVLNPTAQPAPAAVGAPEARRAAGGIRRRLAELAAIGRQALPGALRLLRVIRAERIDLVHLNDVLISNREGILAARLAGVPCLSHVRAFETLTAFDRFLTRYVNAFVYISRAIQASHEAQGVPAERGRVIYNALDLDEFRAGDRAAARAALGLGASEQAVGLIGRLVAWKGHTVFLSAMARLAQTHPRLRCLIVGDTEPTEPAYRQELEALAQRLGLAERVRFTGYQARIPELLPALDVLAHCSLKPEPFGRVIIEGMAAGVPVVGAAAGAVPEIITDGESGLLVPPGDVEALATAVGRLLDEPALAERVRQAARRRVQEAFSIQAHVRQVQDVYRALLGD